MKQGLRAFAGAASLIACLALAGEAGTFHVHFPDIGLKNNAELIEAMRLKVACAHIEGIESIPQDWSLTVVRMTATEEQLTAKAGHGASRLAALGKLDGAVKIGAVDRTCFNVTATFVVSGTRTREVSLALPKIELRPSN